MRFTLPFLPKRAAVLGNLTDWRQSLEAVGVQIVQAAAGTATPDLVVAPARLAADAAAVGAPAIVAEGRGGVSALRKAGYAVQRLLPLPTIAEPEVLLPLDQPEPAVYAVSNWTVAPSRMKQLRNGVFAEALRRRLVPDRLHVLTVGARTPDAPQIVREAYALGVPECAGWFLTLGEGDPFTRGAFHLFRERVASPEWVLKFARVRGYTASFERDERGLALAHTAEPVARHAPRLLGRFTCEGYAASLETSARGRRLTSLLAAPAHRTQKDAAVAKVADWLLEMGDATRSPAPALADELQRLRQEVVPQWEALGADGRWVDDIEGVVAVLQHNDPGPWNVVIDAGLDFVVVDWESARAGGCPLWDLLYFLAEALALVDGALTPDDRELHFARLFRGELPASHTLFAYVRRAASTFDLSALEVGRLATLCWLHHGLSHLARGELLARHGLIARPLNAEPPPLRAARRWLADEALGPSWSRWRV